MGRHASSGRTRTVRIWRQCVDHAGVVRCGSPLTSSASPRARAAAPSSAARANMLNWLHGHRAVGSSTGFRCASVAYRGMCESACCADPSAGGNRAVTCLMSTDLPDEYMCRLARCSLRCSFSHVSAFVGHLAGRRRRSPRPSARTRSLCVPCTRFWVRRGWAMR